MTGGGRGIGRAIAEALLAWRSGDLPTAAPRLTARWRSQGGARAAALAPRRPLARAAPARRRRQPSGSRSALRRDRHRRQQRRDPARRLRLQGRSAGLGRGDPHQSVGRLLPDRRGDAGDARAGEGGSAAAARLWLGPHRQHRLDRRPLRQFRPGRLCERQGRARRPDPRVALDMARRSVTCNAVAPFAATRVTESIRRRTPRRRPTRRMRSRFRREPVANLVAWLAGPAGRGDLRARCSACAAGRSFCSPSRARSRASSRRAGLAGARSARELRRISPLATDLEAFGTEPVL